MSYLNSTSAIIREEKKTKKTFISLIRAIYLACMKGPHKKTGIKNMLFLFTLLIFSGCQNRDQEYSGQNYTESTEKIFPVIKDIKDYGVSEIRIKNFIPEKFTQIQKYSLGKKGESLLISEESSTGYSRYNDYDNDNRLIKSRDFYSDGFGIQTDYIYNNGKLILEKSSPFTVEGSTLRLAPNPFEKKYIYREGLLREVQEGSVSTFYSYRKDGSLKEKRGEDQYGNPEIIFYNAEEQKIRRTTHSGNNQNKETLFFYNIQGDLIRKENFINGKLQEKERFDLEYFSGGKIKRLDNYTLREEQETISYTYNDEGLKSSEIHGTITIHFQYTEEGKLLNKTVKTRDTPPEILEEMTLSYDSGNRKTEEYQKSGRLWRKQKWKYNERGQLLYSLLKEQPGIEREKDGRSYLIEETTEVFYNEQGQPERKLFHNNAGLSTLETYGYDNKGLLVQTEEKDSNGTLKKSLKNIYDSNGNKIQTIVFYSGGRIITDYTYNSEGVLTSSLEKSNDQIISIEYNSAGKTVKEEKKRGDMLEIKLISYSENQNPISIKLFLGQTLIEETEFSYDNNGRILDKQYENQNTGEIIQEHYTYRKQNPHQLLEKKIIRKVRNNISSQVFQLDDFGNRYLSNESIFNAAFHQIIENDTINRISLIKRYNASGDIVRITEYTYGEENN